MTRFTSLASLRLQVGTVVLPLPSGWSASVADARDYSFQIRMRFGLTEVMVEAEDLQTGTKPATSFVFSQFQTEA